MYCSRCGHPLNHNVRLCSRCGQLQDSSGARSRKRPPVRRNYNAIFAITGMAVLAIGLIAALILIFSSGSEKDPSKSSAPAVESRPVSQWTQPEQTTPRETEADTAGNPYDACLQAHADYVLAQSNSRYYCYADIDHLTKQERQIAAYEIRARHGETFSDPNVQAYFEKRQWYAPGGSFSANAYEQANLDLLEVYEAVKNGSWKFSGNPYMNLFRDNDYYAHPYSDTEHLTGIELKDLNKTQLELMRNEIFARHGYIFSSPELRMYFYSMPWYKPTTPASSFNNSVFNEYERDNVELLTLYEERAEGVEFSSNNPYKAYFDPYKDYILPASSTDFLELIDLDGLNADQLCLARNEIAARYGYTFQDPYLLEYFLQYNWYLPQTPAGDNSDIRYSPMEEDNAAMIQKMEHILEDLPSIGSLDRSLGYDLSCSFFTVSVPSYFRDYATVKTDSNGLSFYENISPTIDSRADGHLYSIRVYADPSEYSNSPSARYLGRLVDEEETEYYVVAHFATDVRFTETAKALYSQMTEEYSYITPTLSGINGYTFIAE